MITSLIPNDLKLDVFTPLSHHFIVQCTRSAFYANKPKQMYVTDVTVYSE